MTVRNDTSADLSELGQLVQELTTICGADPGGGLQAEAVRAALTRRLERRDWMPLECRRPDPQAYHPEILHVDEHGAFTLMVMTWLPGQRTPIHDHIAWCVVGIYSGEEQSLDYSLHRDNRGEYLVAAGRSVWRPGDTDILIPPHEDIHQVICGGGGPAVSLHVYGADIRVGRTSINRRFDHLPIRAVPGDVPLTWRDSRRPAEVARSASCPR